MTKGEFIDKYMGKQPKDFHLEKWHELYELMEQDLDKIETETEVKNVSANSCVLSSLLPSKERVEVSDMVMKILTENTHIVDGQVRGVIVHGAVEKLTDIIMEMRKQIA